MISVRTCDNIPLIGNGYVVGPSMSYACGTILTYKCDEGYEMMGRRDLLCTNTGYFTPKPPRCVLPGEVSEQFLASGRASTELSASIFSPFRFVSWDRTPTLIKNRRCWSLCSWTQNDNHLWSMLQRWWRDGVLVRRTVEPLCTMRVWVQSTCTKSNLLLLGYSQTDMNKATVVSEVSCGVTPIFHGQTNTTHNLMCGDSVSYTCDENYTLNGSSTLKCTPAGYLHPGIPNCVKKCEELWQDSFSWSYLCVVTFLSHCCFSLLLANGMESHKGEAWRLLVMIQVISLCLFWREKLARIWYFTWTSVWRSQKNETNFKSVMNKKHNVVTSKCVSDTWHLTAMFSMERNSVDHTHVFFASSKRISKSFQSCPLFSWLAKRGKKCSKWPFRQYTQQGDTTQECKKKTGTQNKWTARGRLRHHNTNNTTDTCWHSRSLYFLISARISQIVGYRLFYQCKICVRCVSNLNQSENKNMMQANISVCQSKLENFQSLTESPPSWKGFTSFWPNPSKLEEQFTDDIVWNFTRVNEQSASVCVQESTVSLVVRFTNGPRSSWHNSSTLHKLDDVITIHINSSNPGTEHTIVFHHIQHLVNFLKK